MSDYNYDDAIIDDVASNTIYCSPTILYSSEVSEVEAIKLFNNLNLDYRKAHCYTYSSVILYSTVDDTKLVLLIKEYNSEDSTITSVMIVENDYNADKYNDVIQTDSSDTPQVKLLATDPTGMATLVRPEDIINNFSWEDKFDLGEIATKDIDINFSSYYVNVATIVTIPSRSSSITTPCSYSPNDATISFNYDTSNFINNVSFSNGNITIDVDLYHANQATERSTYLLVNVVQSGNVVATANIKVIQQASQWKLTIITNQNRDTENEQYFYYYDNASVDLNTDYCYSIDPDCRSLVSNPFTITSDTVLYAYSDSELIDRWKVVNNQLTQSYLKRSRVATAEFNGITYYLLFSGLELYQSTDGINFTKSSAQFLPAPSHKLGVYGYHAPMKLGIDTIVSSNCFISYILGSNTATPIYDSAFGEWMQITSAMYLVGSNRMYASATVDGDNIIFREYSMGSVTPDDENNPTNYRSFSLASTNNTKIFGRQINELDSKIPDVDYSRTNWRIIPVYGRVDNDWSRYYDSTLITNGKITYNITTPNGHINIVGNYLYNMTGVYKASDNTVVPIYVDTSGEGIHSIESFSNYLVVLSGTTSYRLIFINTNDITNKVTITYNGTRKFAIAQTSEANLENQINDKSVLKVIEDDYNSRLFLSFVEGLAFINLEKLITIGTDGSISSVINTFNDSNLTKCSLNNSTSPVPNVTGITVLNNKLYGQGPNGEYYVSAIGY